MSSKQNNLWQKLSKVKASVSYMKKDGKGYNYKYATPETVLSEINPHLLENGIGLKMEVVDSKQERVTNSKDKKETLFGLTFRFTWVNIDNPEERETVEWFASGCNGDEKGVGSAMTYGQRYFLLNQFQIPTGEDDPDYLSRKRNNSSTGNPPQPKQQPAKNKKPGLNIAALHKESEKLRKELKSDKDNDWLAGAYENLLPVPNPPVVAAIRKEGKTKLEKLRLANHFCEILKDGKQRTYEQIMVLASCFKGDKGVGYVSTYAALEKWSEKAQNIVYSRMKNMMIDYFETVAAERDKAA